HLRGIIDVEALMAAPSEQSLADLISGHGAVKVPATAPLAHVAKALDEATQRVAAVTDENGAYLGAVTLQNVRAHLTAAHDGGPARSEDGVATLAGAVAHELNSLLLAAGTYLQAAAGGATGPDASISRAAALTQQAQLLSASLLELFSGPQLPEPPLVDIGSWLPACIDRLAGMLPPGTSLRLEPIEGRPHVRVDPLALEQVLRVLIANAADALNNKGEISVSARRGPSDPFGVEISVSDQGTGIPPADRDRVFEPVFSTRNRSRRSGLGLALAARLVEQAGGSLTHQPNEPRGSTFSVRMRCGQRKMN
ncbi:MAG TPA: ATP-binding protein, partial [Phycisphaerales bacterium]|nr:ATP-binding protein [Phycisphaerales bacterium]